MYNKNTFFFKKIENKSFIARVTVGVQITLSTYKLKSQNKKIIYIK